MSGENTDVRWVRTLELRVYRNEEGMEAPSQKTVHVRKFNEHIGMFIEGHEYMFTPEAIEAIYDLHQDVPR